MTEMYIPLKDEEGNELPYHIDQIFSLEGSEQLYCAAVYYGMGTVESELVILRCDLGENGADTEISVSDILDAEEYMRVAAAYQDYAERAARDAANELQAGEDFLSMVDKDGKTHTFFVHLIFKDETSGREYIAVQEVDDAGVIIEEIALYRFKEERNISTVEMISSDMEYERAKKIFIDIIEKDAGLSGN